MRVIIVAAVCIMFATLPADVRLALGLAPRKLDMGPYESGALGDTFRRRLKAMTQVDIRFHEIELWAHDGSLTTYVDQVVEDPGEIELRRRVARVVMLTPNGIGIGSFLINWIT